MANYDSQGNLQINASNSCDKQLDQAPEVLINLQERSILESKWQLLEVTGYNSVDSFPGNIGDSGILVSQASKVRIPLTISDICHDNNL